MSSRVQQCALQLFCQCLGSLPKLGLTGRTVAGSMLILAHAIIHFALKQFFCHERVLDHCQLQYVTPAQSD